jgi:hypothetical protein
MRDKSACLRLLFTEYSMGQLGLCDRHYTLSVLFVLLHRSAVCIDN